LYGLAAAFALYFLARPPGMDGLGRAPFGDMVYGRAFRPFVGRVLVPVIVRGVVAATPPRAATAVSAWMRARTTRGSWAPHCRDYPYESLVTLVLLFLCLLGFALSLRRLAATVLGWAGWGLDFLPVPALLFLPTIIGVHHTFIYDFPTLFLFTLGLAMLAERRWVLYFAVFTIAVINKESAILLALVWLLHCHRSMPVRLLLIGLAAQGLIWLLIRGSVAMAYSGNPGTPLEWHLLRNIHRFTHLDFYVMTRGPARLLRDFGLQAIAIAGFALVVASLRRAPQFLKDASWILVPLVVLCALFGFFEEIRDYLEFYPIAVLLLANQLALRRRPPSRPLDPVATRPRIQTECGSVISNSSASPTGSSDSEPRDATHVSSSPARPFLDSTPRIAERNS
jgi:hypothetical protein